MKNKGPIAGRLYQKTHCGQTFTRDPLRADFSKRPIAGRLSKRPIAGRLPKEPPSVWKIPEKKQNFIFKNWTKENLNSHPFIELMIFVKKVELKIYLKKLCYNTSLMKKDYFLSNFHAISETM